MFFYVFSLQIYRYRDFPALQVIAFADGRHTDIVFPFAYPAFGSLQQEPVLTQFCWSGAVLRGLLTSIVLAGMVKRLGHGNVTVTIHVGPDGIALGVVACHGACPVEDKLIVWFVGARP